MSISSEIARIEAAKAEIIEAIKRKGVSVPDGVKLDELPAYIDAIKSCTNCTSANLGDATLGTMVLGVGDLVLGAAKLGTTKL